MIKIFKYMEKHDWLFVCGSLVFIVFQIWLALRLPDYMSEITMLVQTEGNAMSDVLSAGGKMILCTLLSLASAFATGYFAAKIAAGLSMRLRKMVYNKTMSFSMEEIKRFSTTSLINRSINDITQVQTLVAMGLQAAVKAPILAVWTVLKIAGKSWQWTSVTGGAVCVLLIMPGTIIALTIPKFSIIQKLTDNLNLVTRENLTGIRVVRAYNAQNYQEEKFEKIKYYNCTE